MADATPVISDAPAPKAKKGASAGIPADVLNGVKSQVEGSPVGVSAEVPFKVSGGVELVSHKAVREDY